MTRGTRVLLLSLVGLVLFGCLGTMGAVALLGSSLFSLGDEPDFSELGIPPRLMHPLFGVTLPPGVLHYEGRQGGFQDPTYEVVVELPPGALETFLTRNGVTRVAPGLHPEPPPDVKAFLARRIPHFAAFKATGLELPDVDADAGSPAGRTATLYEGPGGAVWIYFFAFET